MKLESTQASLFIHRSRAYLMEEYLPKIRRAVLGLDIDDLWWRPNSASNSIGNLILDLAGNIKQWVVGGLGGQEDTRQRQEEFDREGGMSAEALISHLKSTLDEVDTVLAHLTSADLGRELEIQGLPVSGLDALYHAVEHFSMHTGQIIYISSSARQPTLVSTG